MFNKKQRICLIDWHKMIKEGHGKINERINLKHHLLKMAMSDQRMRQSGVVDSDVDKQNAEKLKEIIEKEGWPTIDKVGRAASNAAWLIAQHADHDPAFQAKCLDLMKKEKDSVNPKNIAYLEDRVRVNTGRPQLYGTQFFTDEYAVFKAQAIEDPENLDRRREEVGLNSFAEYEKQIQRLNKKIKSD